MPDLEPQRRLTGQQRRPAPRDRYSEAGWSRVTAGVLCLLLLGTGIALFVTQANLSDFLRMFASSCIRAGLLLGAIWLAFPQLLDLFRRFPPWLMIAFALGFAAIVWRPRTAVVVLPVLLGLCFLHWLGKFSQKPDQ